MLIIKDGIYRDIQEHKFPEYKEKGYRAVEEKEPVIKQPLKKQ